MARISTLVFNPSRGPDTLDQVLPLVALVVGVPVVVWPLAASGERQRGRVAAPPRLRDPSLRATVALLSGLSLGRADLEIIERAVRAGRAQTRADIRELLRAGTSHLPGLTRAAFLDRVRETPFIVAPAHRLGVVVAIIVAVVPGGRDCDALARVLDRLSARVALLFPREAPDESGAHLTRRPAAARKSTSRIDLVLWLDPQGLVGSHDDLRANGVPFPLPHSLAMLVGSSARAEAILRTARSDGPTAEEVVLLADGSRALMSVLALFDQDRNIWGYAALIRREAATKAPDLACTSAAT
jgi:hypothetical protein